MTDIKKKAEEWEQSNLYYEDVRGDVERQLIGFIPAKDWNPVLDKISRDFIEFTKAWVYQAYLAGAKERDRWWAEQWRLIDVKSENDLVATGAVRSMKEAAEEVLKDD